MLQRPWRPDSPEHKAANPHPRGHLANKAAGANEHAKRCKATQRKRIASNAENMNSHNAYREMVVSVAQGP